MSHLIEGGKPICLGMRKGWPVASSELEKRSKVWAHTHWDKTPCVTPQSRNHPHFAFALPNLNGFLWTQNGSMENVCKCSKIPTGRRRRSRHWGQGESISLVWVLCRACGISHSMDTLAQLSQCHKACGIASLFNHIVISKAEILRYSHERSWRCRQWRNGWKREMCTILESLKTDKISQD